MISNSTAMMIALFAAIQSSSLVKSSSERIEAFLPRNVGPVTVLR
jgi:hypothetical protein